MRAEAWDPRRQKEALDNQRPAHSRATSCFCCGHRCPFVCQHESCQTRNVESRGSCPTTLPSPAPASVPLPVLRCSICVGANTSVLLQQPLLLHHHHQQHHHQQQ
ncbi:hypothetical protein DQ04_00201280 [Trypanosoma grayi]|uniref:hypothetical protein n=1 Tax=Trypanosoma grayi TaxID=71804 RepID=UPI0004F4013A|nr:hypothetical protein DQ04_00201280 [Trypanosoma grayi]KEG15075.1 hypothetical protein DQ04_00201280 [Trypanosoma grayi]